MISSMLQCLFPAALQKEAVLTVKNSPLLLSKAALRNNGLQSLDYLVATGSYHGSQTLQRAIKQCKYTENLQILECLNAIFCTVCTENIAPRYTLCPVPMHWWYRWQRGFNLPSLLTQYIVHHSNFVSTPLLCKRFQFGHQAKRSRIERFQALHNIFFACGNVPKQICLIDDVCTTGATLDECARILKNAGAKTVIACTVLYTEPK